MSHVFVSPHPDDAALSCGGLIANLRELGQNVVILSVFTGHGDLQNLTPYQREALGFGGKAISPASESFDCTAIAADHDVPGETATHLAPWQAEPSRLRDTQKSADEAAKEFWQRASWYRKADVLGAGPGGYSAAFRAADLGLDTVLVERYSTLGGVCLNVGCIPSKALLHVAAVMDEAAHFEALGVSFGKPTVNIDKLRAHKQSVIGKLTGGLAGMEIGRAHV